jgi:beta-glucanase (GH16 family)
MNKALWPGIGIILWLAVAAAPVLAGNVLTNPGFESEVAGQNSDVVGWNSFGANTYIETGTNAHSGTNFFKIYQAFNGSVNYNGISQDYISGPGASYTANGWAKTISTDTIAGQNVAWIEITFRDANASVLALYRSSLINTNAVGTGAFPKNTWIDLAVTNQYNPTTLVITNKTSTLVAPSGTYFVRCQVEFQGDAADSAGSVYFDDLNLNLTSAAPYGNWNVVWSDEFNGTAINPATWTFETGNNSGWGNNELEYYTSSAQNAYVSNGILHIAALQQSIDGFSFTSARMKTQGLVTWQYGRFEWRASLPAGTGFWPALWFLGANFPTAGWPACGEMDVTENSGDALANVQGSLHSGSDETAVYTLPNGGSVTNFHLYVLDWSTNAFLWYVDGYLYETQTNWSSSLGNYPEPFNNPSFMTMNLAVGGNYVGNPSVAAIQANGGFPGEMQVDYVRVYNATAPLMISVTRTNKSFLLSWPTNIVAHLQAQIQTTHGGLGTNWTNLANSANPFLVNPTNSSAFYRLQSP